MDFRNAERYMMQLQALDAEIAKTQPEVGESQLTPEERLQAIGKQIEDMPDTKDIGHQRFVNVDFGDDAPKLTLHARYTDIEDSSSVVAVMSKWTYTDSRAPIGHQIKLLGLPETLSIEDLSNPAPDTLKVLGLIEESVDAATVEFAMKYEENAA